MYVCMYVYIYIYILSTLSPPLLPNLPTPLPRGSLPPHLTGFRTESGQTGFSREGHRFLTCCNSLFKVRAHVATFCHRLSHVVSQFAMFCHILLTCSRERSLGRIAALLRRPRLSRPRPVSRQPKFIIIIPLLMITILTQTILIVIAIIMMIIVIIMIIILTLILMSSINTTPPASGPAIVSRARGPWRPSSSTSSSRGQTIHAYTHICKTI